jgi:putative flavoprotein involved in K+ transport
MADCVVVGAGPAGLAASTALGNGGIDHVVLERGVAGRTWRTQRWDSLRLNNPGWMNPMLGAQPAGSYLTAARVCRRLELLAARCLVREQVPVTSLAPDDGGWLLRTGDGPVHARTVVVATGGENVPRTPRAAGLLPLGIPQLHAAAYRRPELLPAGGVLVVGSAQSGYQIAEELLAAGRRSSSRPPAPVAPLLGTPGGRPSSGSPRAGSSTSDPTTWPTRRSCTQRSHCSPPAAAAPACRPWPGGAPS